MKSQLCLATSITVIVAGSRAGTTSLIGGLEKKPPPMPLPVQKKTTRLAVSLDHAVFCITHLANVGRGFHAGKRWSDKIVVNTNLSVPQDPGKCHYRLRQNLSSALNNQ